MHKEKINLKSKDVCHRICGVTDCVHKKCSSYKRLENCSKITFSLNNSFFIHQIKKKSGTNVPQNFVLHLCHVYKVWLQ